MLFSFLLFHTVYSQMGNSSSSVYAKIDKTVSAYFPENKEVIKGLISKSIGLRLSKTKIEKKFASKIGGYPDINTGFKWPTIENRALTFLCQINLEETASYNLSLPKKGMLYFFIAPLSEQRYPEVLDMIKVVYLEDTNFKVTNNFISYPVLEEFTVQFYEHYTIPSYQEKVFLDYNFDDETSNKLSDLEEYIHFLTSNGEEHTPHHMLGDPNAVQGAVKVFWGSRFLNPSDKYYEKIGDNLEKYQVQGSKFELLLQINLDDSRISVPNLGDNSLYFGILKDDLLKKDFSRVFLEIQSS